MKLCRLMDRQVGHTYAVLQPDGSLRRCEFGSPLAIETLVVTPEAAHPESFLPPVDPPAILCVAGNYRKHVEECGMEQNPDVVMFLKNPSAATGHGEPIVIPAVCGDEVDYECELALVIARDCRDVSVAEADRYILGFTIANDVSARVWQLERGGGQWCRGKGFDTFCPLGPYLTTPDEIANPNDLRLTTWLNDRIVQDSRTSRMSGSVNSIVSFLSQGTTLRAGTVILTGTPEGVGWMRDPKLVMQHGDTVRIAVEGLGELVNPVVRQDME